MSTLPIVRGTTSALYPFTQTFHCFTGKSDSEAAKAIRWVSSPPVVTFELPYNPLTQTQKNALKSYFTSSKGQFDKLSQITIAGATYTGLSFDTDEWQVVEQGPTVYNSKWSLTQTVPQNFSPGSSGGAFPTLSTGAISQRPWTQKKRFKTIVSRGPYSSKHTLAMYAGGWTNFPSDGLMGWQNTYPSLTDSETTSIVNHFLANWGDCFPFTYTDEDGTVYSNIYYASPDLVIKRNQPNSSNITISLVQMN